MAAIQRTAISRMFGTPKETNFDVSKIKHERKRRDGATGQKAVEVIRSELREQTRVSPTTSRGWARLATTCFQKDENGNFASLASAANDVKAAFEGANATKINEMVKRPGGGGWAAKYGDLNDYHVNFRAVDGDTLLDLVHRNFPDPETIQQLARPNGPPRVGDEVIVAMNKPPPPPRPGQPNASDAWLQPGAFFDEGRYQPPRPLPKANSTQAKKHLDELKKTIRKLGGVANNMEAAELKDMAREMKIPDAQFGQFQAIYNAFLQTNRNKKQLRRSEKQLKQLEKWREIQIQKFRDEPAFQEEARKRTGISDFASYQAYITNKMTSEKHKNIYTWKEKRLLAFEDDPEVRKRVLSNSKYNNRRDYEMDLQKQVDAKLNLTGPKFDSGDVFIFNPPELTMALSIAKVIPVGSSQHALTDKTNQDYLIARARQGGRKRAGDVNSSVSGMSFYSLIDELSSKVHYFVPNIEVDGAEEKEVDF